MAEAVMSMPKKFTVTPWKVEGEIDYNRLIKDFGTEPLTDELLQRLERHTGKLHHFLRRKVFFSHRDLGWILDKYDKGEKFVMYTGRGPSGNTHIGHLIPWIFCKWLQDKLGVELYFQLTDDEKSLVKQLTMEQTNAYAYENALDVIALGFDHKKTFLFSDLDYAKTMYRISMRVAKHVNFSTAKSVFGFTEQSNIGIIFFPAMQAATCFLPSVLKGKNVPVLIPAAIDQDPYWRISRDVAPKLGYYKPAAIHNVFLPPLTGPGGKMSASVAETAVYTTDSPETVERKIRKYAFSGGRDTIAEHRKKGGNPDVDVSYQWLTFFEESDEKLKRVHDDYKSGAMLTGELKQILIDKLTAFLKRHQENREKARKALDKFVLKD